MSFYSDHSWLSIYLDTLHTQIYIDISRLVKIQHNIPDSHNYFIENLTVKLILKNKINVLIKCSYSIDIDIYIVMIKSMMYYQRML